MHICMYCTEPIRDGHLYQTFCYDNNNGSTTTHPRVHLKCMAALLAAAEKHKILFAVDQRAANLRDV